MALSALDVVLGQRKLPLRQLHLRETHEHFLQLDFFLPG